MILQVEQLFAEVDEMPQISEHHFSEGIDQYFSTLFMLTSL
jgi:hypothetical protein